MRNINKKIELNFTRKVIYVITALFLFFFLLLFKESRANIVNQNAGDSVSLTFSQITPTDKNVTFEHMVMQTIDQKALGSSGAGSQWPVSLESSLDGSLMLYGLDVAGLYKSIDHGENWELAVSGMSSSGVGMFAIDPHNTNHVLALGLGTNKYGGIYASYDKVNSWKKTFSIQTSGIRYLWDGLEFDPTTYNASTNLTEDVYFSTPYRRDTYNRTSVETEPNTRSTLTEDVVGLYKSSDGGESFTLVNNSLELADGIVKITNNGDVYVGNQYGLFLINKTTYEIEESYLENDPSVDYTKGITGLDVVGNTIYAQTWDGIYTLEGEVLTKITNDNYINTWPQFLEVSKSNPNHMIYQARSDVNNYYVSKTIVSFDGGSTWQYATNEKNSLFFKSSWEGREKNYIIDPTDDDNVIAFGSDDLVRSVDGGLHFKQTKGISNMAQAGYFNFNYYQPDLLLFSGLDYTGVISTDGGETYHFLTIPGKGNFSGGFAADKDTYFGFASTGWNGGTLTYTHDGGDTWVDTGLESEMPDNTYYSSLQSPTNPNVFFAAEYYSKDKGYTWNKMDGCVSVFTFNYTNNKELYGGDEDGNLVVSYDNGDTWQKLSNIQWRSSSNILVSQDIVDIAYDHVNNYAYLVVETVTLDKNNNTKKYTNDDVFKYDVTNQVSTMLTMPQDSTRRRSIAVDPNSTSVVYVGGNGNYFSSPTALLRSIDGGITWSLLTTSNNENYESHATNQGGYEVSKVRVNPYDGRVWTANGCLGHETFDPPYDATTLNHLKPGNHTIRYMYNNQLVKEVTIGNNEKHSYIYDEDGLTFVNWYKDLNYTEEVPIGTNIYESMTLYAKMEKSIRIRFYDRNKLLWKIDLDAVDLGDTSLIPIREGYAFVGWYLDSDLTQEADFSLITSDTNVYAGWYKIVEDIFDVTKKDIGNYISYSSYKLQDAREVEDTDDVDDRCVLVEVEKNTAYFISFKMDNRFRTGLKERTKYMANNAVSSPFIHPKDTNSKNSSVNEYVNTIVETGNNLYLLIYYYSTYGKTSFLDIKNTIKVYKLENQDVSLNNQRIEGIDHSILDGDNQTYTINVDNSATFRLDGLLDNFNFLEIDGNTIAASNYLLTNGSIVVTMNKTYMDTLDEGLHTINVVYKDGGEASTNFNVVLGSSNQANDNVNTSPQTADNVLFYVLLFAITCVGIIVIILVSKRYNEKSSY